MSRIGKNPITVPDKVKVNVSESGVSVQGPKGNLEFSPESLVEVSLADGKISVAAKSESKKARSLWGLTRTLISNMVVGVTEGFTKDLEFNGVGYKATVKGNTLTLNLGYSHPIDYALPEGIDAKVTKNVISVSGIDKELVGFTAAKIRSFRPPEPYKGKGIKYIDEVIIRKAGKTGKK